MIKIIEENEFFIVLAKPHGFSAHNQSPSVAEYLKETKKPQHFVNRLDQETSGLMLVAKAPEYHAPLAEALEKGEKFYRALLRGSWKKSENELLWAWPISDKSEGRQNPQGKSQDRVKAETKVRIVRTNQYFTEAYIELLTGRQHQIRKHSALAGHAIIGDNRYGDKKYNDKICQLYGLSRMHLHAEKLVFNFQGTTYEFENNYNLDHFF